MPNPIRISSTLSTEKIKEQILHFAPNQKKTFNIATF